MAILFDQKSLASKLKVATDVQYARRVDFGYASFFLVLFPQSCNVWQRFQLITTQ